MIKRTRNLEEKIKILKDSRKGGMDRERENGKERENMKNKVKEIKRRIEIREKESRKKV